MGETRFELGTAKKNWKETMVKAPKRLTLVLLRATIDAKDQILLGMKKRGFGMGKWNGFGGKVEPGETIEEGALREMAEESGVCVL